jgi:hypothetical protein
MGFQQGIGTNLKPRHRGVVRDAGLTKKEAVHACSGREYESTYSQ